MLQNHKPVALISRSSKHRNQPQTLIDPRLNQSQKPKAQAANASRVSSLPRNLAEPSGTISGIDELNSLSMEQTDAVRVESPRHEPSLGSRVKRPKIANKITPASQPIEAKAIIKQTTMVV